MKDVIAITFDATSGGPTLTAAERRRIDAGLYTGPSGAQVFGGYRGGAVTLVGSAATIAPLTFVAQGSVSATQGAFRGAFVAGDTELSKTLSAAHASLTRFDALDIKVYDHEADGSGLRGADIILTAGTPSGTPAAPTVAGTTVRMGYFNVPPSGGGAATFVPATGSRYTSVGGARPGTTAGDLEIYHPDDAVWRRVYETVPAHFSGGYDPGVASSITNNTWTPVPITDVVSNSRVTLVSGNSLRIDEAGLYQCNGQTRLGTGTASGTGRSRFSVNTVEKRQYNAPLTANSLALPLSCQLRLDAADVLRFEVQQDQGSGRLFANGVNYNFIDIARIG